MKKNKLTTKQRIAWQLERAFIYVGMCNDKNGQRFIRHMDEREKLFWMSPILCPDCHQHHPVWVEFVDPYSEFIAGENYDYSPNQVNFPNFIKRCDQKFFKKYRFLFNA